MVTVQQCPSWESNRRPVDCKSIAILIASLCHLFYCVLLLCYCLDEACWTAVNSASVSPGAQSPVSRHSHSAVVHRHRMWIYGGLSGLTELDDLWTWHFGKYSTYVSCSTIIICSIIITIITIVICYCFEAGFTVCRKGYMIISASSTNTCFL